MKRFLLFAILPLLMAAGPNDTKIVPKKDGGNVVIQSVTAGGVATDAVTVSNTGVLKVDQITNAAGTGQPVGGVPSGAIMAFGMAVCPTGWLAADGVAKATATYPALDVAFATTWGARSGGNFQIPDLNSAGRYLRGGTAGTLQAQATAKNGLAVTNNAVTSLDQNANHSHNITSGVGYGSGGGLGTQYGLINTNNPSDRWTQFSNSVQTANHGHSVTSNVTLGNGDAETRPITAVVNYCIKY